MKTRLSILFLTLLVTNFGYAEICFKDITKGDLMMKHYSAHPEHDKKKAKTWLSQNSGDKLRGYTKWPFDLIFFNANGDAFPDLFMVNHAHNLWSRLWLGDGRGGFRLVDPKNMGSFERKGGRGSYSLLAMIADRDGVWLGRNDTETENHWLKVKVNGPKGNPEAAGTSLTLYKSGKSGDKQVILGHRQVIFSTDFHTMGATVHFGLGKVNLCDLRVIFPGGQKKELQLPALQGCECVNMEF